VRRHFFTRADAYGRVDVNDHVVTFHSGTA
jgi:hypothetical protein